MDYAQLVKLYGNAPEGPTRRYGPAECTGAKKVPIEGNPDPKHISTSYSERSNLTMRMHMRRLTRLTNAFSKKVENHAYAVALHMMYYDFVRIHKTLRVTPAMAAGVSGKLWEIGDIAKLVEDAEEPAAKARALQEAGAKPQRRLRSRAGSLRPFFWLPLGALFTISSSAQQQTCHRTRFLERLRF